MIKRTILFLFLSTIIWAGMVVYDSQVQPQVATQLNVESLNGGNVEAANLRTAQHVNNRVPLVAAGLDFGALLLCYGAYAKRGITAARKEINNA
jgi:hypothetical protein